MISKNKIHSRCKIYHVRLRMVYLLFMMIILIIFDTFNINKNGARESVGEKRNIGKQE